MKEKLMLAFVVINIIFYLVYLLFLEKNKKNNSDNKTIIIPEEKYSDNDLILFDNIINLYLDYYMLINIVLPDKIYIDNNQYEKLLKDISINILNIISDDYKKILFQRFSEEGIVIYIFTKIMPRIIQKIKEINSPQ